MKSFSVHTRGLDTVLRNAEKFARDKVDGVDKLMDRIATEVAAEARANAKGSIATGIYANTSQRFRKTVGSHNPIAAYNEFGTGKHVFQGAYSFTADEKKFAKQFYVSGKGTTKSHATLFPAFRKGITALENGIINLLKFKRR